jgi:hypothetical protein
MIMTTAEKLRQEGRTEEKSQVAINFLKLGTDPRIVANATGLPLARIKELEAKTKTKEN